MSFNSSQGPLVGIEKQIRTGLKFVDPDFLDDYISGKFHDTGRLRILLKMCNNKD